MGLFDFLRRDERAMPDPESPEFQQTVAESELPDSSGAVGVEPSEWTAAERPVRPRETDRES